MRIVHTDITRINNTPKPKLPPPLVSLIGISAIGLVACAAPSKQVCPEAPICPPCETQQKLGQTPPRPEEEHESVLVANLSNGNPDIRYLAARELSRRYLKHSKFIEAAEMLMRTDQALMAGAEEAWVAYIYAPDSNVAAARNALNSISTRQ